MAAAHDLSRCSSPAVTCTDLRSDLVFFGFTRNSTVKLSPVQHDGVGHRWRLRWTLVGIDSVSLRGEMKGGNQREQGTGRGNETGPFSNWFASLTPVFCLAALPSPVPRPPVPPHL